MSTKRNVEKNEKVTSVLTEKIEQKKANKYLVSPVAYDNLNMAEWRHESQLYRDAYKVAVRYLDKQLSKDPDFEWLKCDPRTVSFDDITFRYKGTVVSILLKIFYNGKLVLWDSDMEMKWVDISDKNNLFPLVIPITITSNSEKYEVRCGMCGLEFWDWMTTDTMNPIEMASDKRTKMSHYELLNAAIREVVHVLEKRGCIISDWRDDPTFPDTQCKIYFVPSYGTQLSWVTVKYGINKDIHDITKPDLNKADHIIPGCDGYFAPIVFECENDKPCRGDKLKVRRLPRTITKIYDYYTKTIL